MSLQDYISTNVNAPPGVLTRELLERAWEHMRNRPPDPCSLGRHVVSVTALNEEWEYATCGNCYRRVKLR